jgi:hypothetical protein
VVTGPRSEHELDFAMGLVTQATWMLILVWISIPIVTDFAVVVIPTREVDSTSFQIVNYSSIDHVVDLFR